MDLTLKGKNAIVTGGSSNIGRSIVSTLAQEGANIVVFAQPRSDQMLLGKLFFVSDDRRKQTDQAILFGYRV